jgi:hypothetical protein
MIEYKNGIYTDGKKEYDRVSALLEFFAPAFNKDMIIKNTAKRDGTSMKAVTDQWQDALDKGDSLHRAIEKKLNGLPVDEKDKDYEEVAQWVLYEIIKHGYHHWDSEKPLSFEGKINLAGTPDAVGFRSRSNKSIVDIFDAKGNLAKFTIRGKGKYFAFPIDYLEYTYYNRTAIQMSFYMYMKEAEGYRPGVLTAPVIDRDDPTRRAVYQMPYMKNEVEMMMNIYSLHTK